LKTGVVTTDSSIRPPKEARGRRTVASSNHKIETLEPSQGLGHSMCTDKYVRWKTDVYPEFSDDG
jgi:hypothetical protein